ncbi:TPA: LacI family transcriptional regulator, partial [Candidatus Poribacteria bacterium]|nr:LacI family transcriptional regulator [Candidatus Poribacteria bacterium]
AGFDNIPLAALAKPRLTTIAIPAYKMGQEAMEMLMRNITDEDQQGEEKILEVELVKGESCRCIR